MPARPAVIRDAWRSIIRTFLRLDSATFILILARSASECTIYSWYTRLRFGLVFAGVLLKVALPVHRNASGRARTLFGHVWKWETRPAKLHLICCHESS